MIDKDIIEQAKEQLIAQNKEKVLEIANQVIADGGDPLELMNQAFIPGINKVGDLFGRGQLFLPELMVAADAMQGGHRCDQRGIGPTGWGAGKKGKGYSGHGQRRRTRYRQMYRGFSDAGQRNYRF